MGNGFSGCSFLHRLVIQIRGTLNASIFKYCLVFISCILIVHIYTFGDEPLATRACLYKRIDNTGFLHYNNN